MFLTWFWGFSVGKTAAPLSSVSSFHGSVKAWPALLFLPESSPKNERRPGHVESSRSCASVSSWMKTCTATWSGSRTLKSWMQTVREKVSAGNHLSSRSSVYNHEAY